MKWHHYDSNVWEYLDDAMTLHGRIIKIVGEYHYRCILTTGNIKWNDPSLGGAKHEIEHLVDLLNRSGNACKTDSLLI